NRSSVPEGPNVYRNSTARIIEAPEERNIPRVKKLLLRSFGAKNIMAQIMSYKHLAALRPVRPRSIMRQRITSLSDKSSTLVATHVNRRPVFFIGFCLPEYFPRDGRRVAFSKRHVIEKIGNGISRTPAEIGVRQFAGPIAQIEKESRDCVRYY